MAASADLRSALRVAALCQAVRELEVGVASGLRLDFALPRYRDDHYRLIFLCVRRERVDGCEAVNGTNPYNGRVVANVRSYAVLRRVFPKDDAFVVIRRVGDALFGA